MQSPNFIHKHAIQGLGLVTFGLEPLIRVTIQQRSENCFISINLFIVMQQPFVVKYALLQYSIGVIKELFMNKKLQFSVIIIILTVCFVEELHIQYRILLMKNQLHARGFEIPEAGVIFSHRNFRNASVKKSCSEFFNSLMFKFKLLISY